jgi:hypothetical protein
MFRSLQTNFIGLAAIALAAAVAIFINGCSTQLHFNSEQIVSVKPAAANH